MTNIGTFGNDRPPAELSFTFFGSEIRVNPELTDIAAMNLFNALENGTNPAAAIDAVARGLVHADDFDEFWQLMTVKRQTLDDLAELGKALIAAVTERPTRLPAVSSDGQQATGESSEVDSSSRDIESAITHLPPGLAADVIRLAGRREVSA